MRLARRNQVNLSVSDLDRASTGTAEFGLVAAANESVVPPATNSPIRYRSLVGPNTMAFVVGFGPAPW